MSFKSFSNFVSLSKQPFIIYCDTETNTEKERKLFSYMLYCKHAYDSSLDRIIMRTAENDDEIGEKLCYRFMNDLTNLRIHIAYNVNIYTEMNPKEREEFTEKNPKPNCCQWCFKKEETTTEPIQLMLHHDHNIKENNIINCCRGI